MNISATCALFERNDLFFSLCKKYNQEIKIDYFFIKCYDGKYEKELKRTEPRELLENNKLSLNNPMQQIREYYENKYGDEFLGWLSDTVPNYVI